MTTAGEPGRARCRCTSEERSTMAWLEQAALRTQKAKHYQDSANPTLRRAEFAVHDLHYHDGAAWQDVSETLVTGTVTGFVHKCDTARHAIHIGATGTRRWCPRRAFPNEYVEFGRLQSWSGTAWTNVNLGTPVRTGNKIVWSTVNFDLTLVNDWHRIKITAVLKTEAARRRLRWQVSLNGLTWNNWTLVSKSDAAVVGTIERPLAWDATQNPKSEDFAPNVQIANTYSGGYVEFGGDLSTAVLPVTIDPTFTDGYGGDVATSFDTYVQINAATTNYGTNDTMAIRSSGGSSERHALLKFDLSSIPAGAVCNSATLYLYNDGTPYVATETIYEILAANAAWTEAGATWNTKDGTNNWAGGNTGCGTSGTDRSATSIGAFTTAAGDTNPGQEYVTALTTTRVDDWFGGSINIEIESSDNHSEYVGSSDHATTGYRPKLVIAYTAGGKPWYAYAQQ